MNRKKILVALAVISLNFSYADNGPVGRAFSDTALVPQTTVADEHIQPQSQLPASDLRRAQRYDGIAIFTKLGIKSRIGHEQLEALYQGFYQQHPHKPFIWLTAEYHLTPQGHALLARIKNSATEGLSANLYHLVKLEALVSKTGQTQEDARIIDLLLSEAALSYLRDVAIGRPEVMRADKDWLLERNTLNPVPILLTALGANSTEALEGLFEQVEPKHTEYQRIKKALNDYALTMGAQTAEPTLTLGKKLSRGDSGARVGELRARLVYLGLLDVNQGTGAAFDAVMDEAVKRFQKTHFLEPDGVVGVRTQQELNLSKSDRLNQLKVNLERWRWMPKDLGEHYLVVDIPGFEYYIVANGREVMRAKTVVGMAQRSTPVFMAPMNHIVFSPYWNVPRSMAVKDKLPQLKRDPNRLARSKIRIIDKNGNEIDPNMVDWSRYNENNFPYRLRQDPGSYNALGRVKFMFPNKHAIYLHDTPQKSLFSKTERTFSSGCIRVENPIELAEYFLSDQNWTRDRVKKAYDGSRENTVRLKEGMRFPVYTLYMTVKVDNAGEVSFRSDIYGRDQAMISAIGALERR